MARSLSAGFFEDLKAEGKLSELVEYIKKDDTLDLQIRGEQVHIYYRGGKILDITPTSTLNEGYNLFMDKEYSKGGHKVPEPGMVLTDKDMQQWLQRIPNMKQAIDFYLGHVSANFEREFQQLLARENTYSPISNATDYFIVGLEYQTTVSDGKTTKFDLVGIRWESEGPKRKLPKKYAPRLAIFEMKYGDNALSGKAGLKDHLDKTLKFVEDTVALEAFK